MAVCLGERETLLAAERVVSTVSKVLGERSLLLTPAGSSTTDMGGQASFWWSPSRPIERMILHSLRSHVVSCESRYPGSGEIAIRTAVRVSEHWMAQSRLGRRHGELADVIDQAIASVGSVPVRRRRLLLEEAVELASFVPGKGGEDLRSCIPLLPVGTSISVRLGAGQETTLLRSSGARFRVHAPPVAGQQPRLTSPKVVAVDGTIESVSQIHSLLTSANESGEHYLIVCRHSEPDVDHTIQVNNARGTIRAVIVHSRLDDLTVGALEDIAAYTGADVVSRESGATIGSAVDRAPSVRGRVWLDEGVLRVSAPAAASLSSHLSRLRDDMGAGDQSVRDFLSQRVSGMSADRAEVHLGRGDAARSPSLLERIDTSMRVLARCVESGASQSMRVHVEECPEILSLCDIEGAEAALVPGSGQAGITQGLRFARDLCTLGFSVSLDPASGSTAPALAAGLS
jgi:hypothetical protein